MRSFSLGFAISAAAVFATVACLNPPPARAADHRDAPAVDGVGEGDISDIFAFLDPNDRTKLVLAMGVNPFSVPALLQTYHFSNAFLYQFKIDYTSDYKEDVVVQVSFRNTATSQNIHVRIGAPDPTSVGAINTLMTSPAIDIVGPIETVINDPSGVQVFAGQRNDPFVLDGQYFRIIAGTQDVFRDIPASPLGPLHGRPVGANGQSGIDSFAGFNVSYIVVEVPLAAVGPGFFQNASRIYNIWGTVSSPYVDDSYVQFERMGQPLFNTVFIPAALKDACNAGVPSDDVARFASYVPDALTTTDNDGTGNTIAGRATLLTNLGLGALPYGAPLLLPSTFANTSKDLLRSALVPDVLRLNLDAAPTDLGIGQSGLINGRRPGDNVVDIALRVLRQLADVNFPSSLGVPGSGPARAGALTFPDRRIFAVLQGSDFVGPDSNIGSANLGSSANDLPLLTTFPFLAPPHPRPGDPQASQ
ncbi:exported hypothetical protein [Candidatus Sulfopaludibacter sp. SbA4]|nr:exported hypothetical protein [Candidatus Sulfopaludibacter sp. SbA4]